MHLADTLLNFLVLLNLSLNSLCFAQRHSNSYSHTQAGTHARTFTCQSSGILSTRGRSQSSLLLLLFACYKKASNASFNYFFRPASCCCCSCLLLVVLSAVVVVLLSNLPHPSPDLRDLLVLWGRERESRGGGLRKCVNLLDLGVEIDLIVEPTIVLSSSQLGTVEGFPQVFGRQLTTGMIESKGGKG